MEKNISNIFVVFSIVFSFAATECSKRPQIRNNKTEEKVEEKTKEKVQKANNILNMIELNALTSKDYTLKVGEKVYFQMDVHASVGIGLKYENSNEDVLKLFSDEYNFKRKQEPGMTGGDAATQVLTFEAIKVGEAKLIFKKNYRGKIEETTEFNITVK